MNKIIYLDLDKVTLFGWERRKSDLVIDSIIKGIEAGDEFPAVSVHKGEKGKFYLSDIIENYYGLPDGGHNRAVGHYIAGKSLKCELLRGNPPFPGMINVAIPDILIVDDAGDFKTQKKRFPKYR